MAGSKTDFAELKVLDLLLGNQSYAPGANSVLALYTVSPGETGGGTEANYTSYARATVTNNLTTWPSANPKSNGIVISFPKATGDQSGNIVAVAVFDNGGTNMLAYATLTTPKPVLNGDTPSFAIGALVFTED